MHWLYQRTAVTGNAARANRDHGRHRRSPLRPRAPGRRADRRRRGVRRLLPPSRPARRGVPPRPRRLRPGRGRPHRRDVRRRAGGPAPLRRAARRAGGLAVRDRPPSPVGAAPPRRRRGPRAPAPGPGAPAARRRGARAGRVGRQRRARARRAARGLRRAARRPARRRRPARPARPRLRRRRRTHRDLGGRRAPARLARPLGPARPPGRKGDPMSTDFFGDLERQLVTATRERPRRLRLARARRAAAGAVTAAALAGAAALAVTVASRPHDDVRAPATPVTHRGEPLPSPAVLRGIRVALVGDPVALGLRGGLADALTREGVHVASVRSSVPERATRVYFAPGHDRDAAGVAIVLHARGLTPAYAPVRPMTPAMRREAGGAGVLLIAGAERIAVLNATTIPGLGRATALRLQAR